MRELLVYRHPLTESNCYILARDGACVVIDPNDPVEVPALLLGRGWRPELVLLTHEHCDHMAGLEALRQQWPQSRVLCSEACDRGIQDPKRNMSQRMEVYLAFQGKTGVSYPPFVCRPADETFEAFYTMAWRGHRLRCVSLPGHTPGSICVFWDEKILFSGDYLLPGQEVILRLPGGSRADYETVTLPFLAALPPGLEVCPGHGDSFTLTGKELRGDDP